MKFLTYLDLTGNEVRNVIAQNLAGAPASPVAGQFYFDTGLHEFGYFNGSAWVYTSSGTVQSVTAADGTVTIGGSATNPTVKVAKTLDHSYITDFDAQVRSSRLDQLATPGANVAWGGYKITGLANGSAGSDAATVGQLPTTLPPSGAAGGDLAGNYPNPTLAATANVESIIRANRLDQFTAPNASVSFGGQRITNLAEPISSQDAATKNYVDTVAQGLSVKAAVAVAATSPLPANSYSANVLTASANGALTVDGVAVTAGQRVLVAAEATAANNGIYVVTDPGSSGAPYVLTRSNDMTAGTQVPGSFVFVESGSTNANNGYVVSSGVGPYTIGTTAITWTQFSGAGEITAGTGLSKSGNTISLSTPVSLANGGTGASTAAAARANLGATTKYVATVGDGSTQSFTVNHQLGTRDVEVQVYDLTTYETVFTQTVRTDANNVTVSFALAPAANAYRVIVIG